VFSLFASFAFRMKNGENAGEELQPALNKKEEGIIA